MHAAAGLAASEADSVALGIIYCLLCEYSSFSCNFFAVFNDVQVVSFELARKYAQRPF